LRLRNPPFPLQNRSELFGCSFCNTLFAKQARIGGQLGTRTPTIGSPLGFLTASGVGKAEFRTCGQVSLAQIVPKTVCSAPCQTGLSTSAGRLRIVDNVASEIPLFSAFASMGALPSCGSHLPHMTRTIRHPARPAASRRSPTNTPGYHYRRQTFFTTFVYHSSGTPPTK